MNRHENERQNGATAVGRQHADRLEVHHDRDLNDRGERDDLGRARDHMADRDAAAREQFGGLKWGAAFFGWLSANGLNVLLLALASAAGAALGLTQATEAQARSNAGTISIVGGVVLLVILALGYFAGGYVAGRMARFNGAKQGLGVWLVGLLVTAALAVAGAILGSQYNVLSQLNLPRVPIDEGDATTGGIIALALVLLVTLGAALLGGKTGTRYHRRIDHAV